MPTRRECTFWFLPKQEITASQAPYDVSQDLLKWKNKVINLLVLFKLLLSQNLRIFHVTEHLHSEAEFTNVVN